MRDGSQPKDKGIPTKRIFLLQRVRCLNIHTCFHQNIPKTLHEESQASIVENVTAIKQMKCSRHRHIQQSREQLRSYHFPCYENMTFTVD